MRVLQRGKGLRVGLIGVWGEVGRAEKGHSNISKGQGTCGKRKWKGRID